MQHTCCYRKKEFAH